MADYTGIIVRRARLEDIIALPEIERSAAEAFRATAHAWVADDDVTESDAYSSLVFGGSLWVAEVAGEIIGFVSADLAADALHILEIAVAFAHQREGAGRCLMQAAIQAARAGGLPAVTLTTFRDVAFNAPFYRALGFDILETTPPRLQAILSVERGRGLEQRCAMRLAL
jgi:GNAT superfamily N-acetyltransferase